ISVAEARRRLPILGERGIVAITWSPTDCNVEPSEVPLGYCRAAEKLGAVLLPHTPATGLEIGPRGGEGVRTPSGASPPRGVVAITWSPTDCNVEPSEVPLGYCRAAEKLGAVLLPHTPATGFEIGPRGVEGVRTPSGAIATRVVVDAAGAWARVLATALGAS